MEFYCKSVLETKKAAATIAEFIKSGDVVAFEGSMGAGKTTFIAGLLEAINPNAEVSSPTFSLVHEYSGIPIVYHFDMYRIDNYDDLYSTGFFDYLDMDCIILIEWSENIKFALPDSTKTIKIEIIDENTRRITFENISD